MVITRKTAKKNGKLLSICRPVIVRLTRESFKSYEISNSKVKIDKSSSRVAVSSKPRTRNEMNQ